MTDKEKEEFKNALYHNYLDKCLKKTKLNIIANPSGFVRGIPQQLASDMYILAMDNIEKISDKETLKRLKHICEYFLSKRSSLRIAKENNPDVMIYDKFSVYEKQLNQIDSISKKLDFKVTLRVH